MERLEIDEKIRQRIEKLHALTSRGSTPGEKNAAKEALNRLTKKYNISEDEINTIDLTFYEFKYNSTREYQLLSYVLAHFEPQILQRKYYRVHNGRRLTRTIAFKMNYLEWVSIDSAYEYFRRHMNSQWSKFCAPHVKRCRTAKGKKRRRDQLSDQFLSEYLIKSGLVPDIAIETTELSGAELAARNKVRGVEGGRFNRQVTNGLMLD